jgi:hypothetical protein
MMDDELNVLPTSSLIKYIEPVSTATFIKYIEPVSTATFIKYPCLEKEGMDVIDHEKGQGGEKGRNEISYPFECLFNEASYLITYHSMRSHFSHFSHFSPVTQVKLSADGTPEQDPSRASKHELKELIEGLSDTQVWVVV